MWRFTKYLNPGFIWEGSLKKAYVKLKHLKAEELLLLEKFLRCRIKMVMGDRIFESTEDEEHLYVDANNVNASSSSWRLPTDEC